MQTEEWQLIWQCLRDLTGTFKYLVKSEKDERKEIMRLLRELQKVHHKSDGLGSCIRYVNINIFTRNKSSSVAERFSWLLTENNNSGVIEGLKNTYRFIIRGNPFVFIYLIDHDYYFCRTKLLPLEKLYGFHDFHSPSLSDVDFEVLPQVLVIGN